MTATVPFLKMRQVRRTMKTRATQLVVLAIAAVGLSACAGPRAFTRGTYEDPEQIAMLDDRYTRVCCSEIDTNGFLCARHPCAPYSFND